MASMKWSIFQPSETFGRWCGANPRCSDPMECVGLDLLCFFCYEHRGWAGVSPLPFSCRGIPPPWYDIQFLRPQLFCRSKSLLSCCPPTENVRHALFKFHSTVVESLTLTPALCQTCSTWRTHGCFIKPRAFCV